MQQFRNAPPAGGIRLIVGRSTQSRRLRGALTLRRQAATAAIIDLGHEKPTLLHLYQTHAATLIDRYARRMINENIIADAIDFFHMDALSAAVPLKIDLDVQLTVMASMLYRTFAHRVGNDRVNQKSRTLFRDLVQYRATVHVQHDHITVTMARRAHSITMRNTDYHDATMRIPWLNNLPLMRIPLQIDQ